MSDCQTRSPPYRVLPRFHVGALATVAHTVTGPDDENRTFWPLHVQTRCRAPGEPENDIRLFLDSPTTPICRRGEPMLDDPTFAIAAPGWDARRSFVRVRQRLQNVSLSSTSPSRSTLVLLFAERSARPFVFFPGGWDLTHAPFPVRSRSSRRRGRADINEAVIAVWQCRGIRGAASICWQH